MPLQKSLGWFALMISYLKMKSSSFDFPTGIKLKKQQSFVDASKLSMYLILKEV